MRTRVIRMDGIAKDKAITRGMLKGESHRYGKLLVFQSEGIKWCRKRFSEILDNWGVKTVINTTKHYSQHDLVFEEPTLLILPNIADVLRTGENPDSIILNKIKFVLHPYYVIIDKECKRIKKNNCVLMDYYKKRNLIIMYFNLFIIEPRIKIFDNIIKELKELSFQNIVYYDNTEWFVKANILKNSTAFMKNLKNQYGKLVDTNETLNNSITRASREIIRDYRTINVNINLLKTFKTMMDNFLGEFQKNVLEVKELPFVQEVKITEKGVYVDFDDINIPYKGKDVYIGKINIIIQPDKIEFENRNNSKLGYAHPHTGRNGTCFGSYGSDVRKLLGSLQLKKLVFLLYQFLRTYNPKSPLLGISNWMGSKTK